ncbi:MAG: hypothetical protein QNJ55_25440 [Xenococcus sp. MO_188.B8]|nr:hypothetical protein [Xenococcus sp. MO_188.B8]
MTQIFPKLPIVKELVVNQLQSLVELVLESRLSRSRSASLWLIASNQWGLSPNQLAEEYGLTEARVNNALGFYAAYQTEIDRAIAEEQAIETANV